MESAFNVFVPSNNNAYTYIVILNWTPATHNPHSFGDTQPVSTSISDTANPPATDVSFLSLSLIQMTF